MNDKEFFKVAESDPRYKDVDDNNLGFADPEKHKAYVRYTSWPALNKYLITHEFEHMVEGEDKCSHEDAQGIRHKKGFRDIIAPALPFLGGAIAGPLGGLIGGGISGASAARHDPDRSSGPFSSAAFTPASPFRVW